MKRTLAFATLDSVIVTVYLSLSLDFLESFESENIEDPEVYWHAKGKVHTKKGKWKTGKLTAWHDWSRGECERKREMRKKGWRGLRMMT